LSIHLYAALISQENELILDCLPRGAQPRDPRPRIRKIDMAADVLIQERERIVRHGDPVTPNV
jgi:hypothetical protein